jgi:uracil-DNA glycosylase
MAFCFFIQTMFDHIQNDWLKLLQKEFSQPYFRKLTEFLKHEYQNHTCYPNELEIFSAFNYCSPSLLKVVILGQDPYHGPGQANGLCFSVGSTVPHPPSLKNIFLELKENTGQDVPQSGDLSHWAKQGVLLLNATLTVRAHQAGSHQGKGWETFTDNVIKTISDQYEGIIFLCWGAHARKKVKLIDSNKHQILTAGHPSPLSANRGHWFGHRHFVRTNELLKSSQRTPIQW